MDYRFPRKEKLKGRDDIRDVFNCRKSVSCHGAKLFMLQNGLDYNRIAFTFPRKYGNAVERNRSKRLSREAYRRLRNEIRKGYDLVLLVYPGRGPGSPANAGQKLPLRENFQHRMIQLRGLFSRAGLFISTLKVNQDLK